MLQTLFYIPATIGGMPLFGWGVLAWAWLAWCAGLMLWRLKRGEATTDLASQLGVAAMVLAMLVFVGPKIMEYDEAGKPLGVAIRGYGVMLLAGIVSGVGLAVYRAKRRGVSADVIMSLALWVFVAGMVGARAFYVIEYWPQFQRETFGETIGAMVNMTRGGLVVFGAFIGALGALFVFVRRHKLPLLPLADLVAPCMTLGLALGRVGCFFNGCCFGDLCTLPWSVEFPAMSPPHARQIETGRLFGFTLSNPRDGKNAEGGPPIIATVEPGSPAERSGLKVGEALVKVNGTDISILSQARETIFTHFREGHLPLGIVTDYGTRIVELPQHLATHSRPVHPVQIYSAIDALLTTLLLLAFQPLQRRDGETFALLLGLHAVSRFLLEIIRIDEASVFGTGLSISQNISVVMLAGAIGLWLYLRRSPPQTAWPVIAAA